MQTTDLKLTIILLLTCLSCNNQTSSSSNSSAHPSATPGTPATPTHSQPAQLSASQIKDNYDKYFVSKKTTSEQAFDQTAYLKKPLVTEVNPPVIRNDQKLKVTKAYRHEDGVAYAGLTPCVPMIGQYEQNVLPSPPSSHLKIPNDFLPNIPESIKNTASQYDLNEIDLFLVVQNGMDFLDQSSNIMLVNHFWGMNGTFQEYQRWMEMGIFDSDLDISRQIQAEKLQNFEVIVHDGNKLSPNTAGLHLKTSMLDLSFYSLVIDSAKKRAAITLHILISNDHYMDFNFYVFDVPTVERFLNQLHNHPSQDFTGSPLLKKLDLLFKIAE